MSSRQIRGGGRNRWRHGLEWRWQKVRCCCPEAPRDKLTPPSPKIILQHVGPNGVRGGYKNRWTSRTDSNLDVTFFLYTYLNLRLQIKNLKSNSDICECWVSFLYNQCHPVKGSEQRCYADVWRDCELHRSVGNIWGFFFWQMFSRCSKICMTPMALLYKIQ